MRAERETSIRNDTEVERALRRADDAVPSARVPRFAPVRQLVQKSAKRIEVDRLHEIAIEAGVLRAALWCIAPIPLPGSPLKGEERTARSPRPSK